ncbi:MAG TPA: phosphotransferase [Gaiellales bacterium]|nr:phosphotransferase [Gaiellales bacterium]
MNAWIPAPTEEHLRAALHRVAPELATAPIEPNDILDTGNPWWARGTAWVGDTHIVKFAWSRPAAGEVLREARVLEALRATSAAPICPPLETTSERPAMIVSRRVVGDPVGFGSSPSRQLAEQLAAALAVIHDPATLAAVGSVVDLPAPVPQADIDSIRTRLDRFLSSADAAVVRRWCDWIDEVQRTVWGDHVLLHGDLHGYNILQRGGDLVCLLDFGDVCEGDHQYDFRYLPAMVGSIDLFTAVAEAYERSTGRHVAPAPVLAWHLRTMLGDALWRSEANVPLPDGGTVHGWICSAQERIGRIAAWRPFDRP